MSEVLGIREWEMERLTFEGLQKVAEYGANRAKAGGTK